jgi:hypothetical protein
MAFKGRNSIQQAHLAKSTKNVITVLLSTQKHILSYDIDKASKELRNKKNIY